jgi:hypothetical protein
MNAALVIPTMYWVNVRFNILIIRLIVLNKNLNIDVDFKKLT